MTNIENSEKDRERDCFLKIREAFRFLNFGDLDKANEIFAKVVEEHPERVHVRGGKLSAQVEEDLKS